jgi:hypothetical protein
VQQLSWSPRLYLYKNFISDEECEHLITRVRVLTTQPPSIPLLSSPNYNFCINSDCLDTNSRSTESHVSLVVAEEIKALG